MLQTIRGGAPFARREALSTTLKKVLFFGTSVTVWIRIKNVGAAGVIRIYTSETEADTDGSEYVTLIKDEVLEGLFATTGFWMKAESDTPVVEILAGVRTP